MEVGLQEHVAFYLTGHKPGNGLEPVDGLGLRPALFSGYRDLARLRYDYPLVLVEGGPPDRTCVQSLSGIIDGVTQELAVGPDGDRITRHVLRLEQQIRSIVASGGRGSLSMLWDDAAQQITATGDDLIVDSLRRARAKLKVDGQVIDCDRSTPLQVVQHVWSRVQESHASRTRDRIDRLILKLSDILRVDFSRSEAGRTPDNLKAAIGEPHAQLFDFEAMSRLLGKSSSSSTLPASRRRRIERVLDVLKSQRFFETQGRLAARTGSGETFSFVFPDCVSALAAYQRRMSEAVELARAMAIADLEVDSRYDESAHDSIFAEFGADGLDPVDAALFPDYLVTVDALSLHGEEHDAFIEILSTGLPMKVLVQTDDILDAPTIGRETQLSFGLRSRQLASMVIGLNEVYLFQASASHLYRLSDRILSGIAGTGPAVFSIFSGASGSTEHIPPYLLAAAAMESRAFPALSYDPNAGTSWADRFSLAANPQPERDWPVHHFAYEDEQHQRVETDVPFTLVDFAACDHRFARHFARVPRAAWSDSMVAVNEAMDHASAELAERIPSLLAVDGDNLLHRVIVNEKLIAAARRNRDGWHSWQELGGIHNSFAERLLAREREAWEATQQQVRAAAEFQPATSLESPTVDAASSGSAETAPVEEAAAPSTDEAYVETSRCTTCNECTQINNKMFAYDDNKQCYIADLKAGTYRDLVEAAENCQVAIIHPGKPWNPNEPGLEELIKRAEPFL